MTPDERDDTEQTRVYVVIGVTGEYSDRKEWWVCGYRKEADAQRHADAAMMEARRIANEIHEETPTGDYNGGLYHHKNKYDPHFSLDYTGTDYCVGVVTIRDGGFTP